MTAKHSPVSVWLLMDLLTRIAGLKVSEQYIPSITSLMMLRDTIQYQPSVSHVEEIHRNLYLRDFMSSERPSSLSNTQLIRRRSRIKPCKTRIGMIYEHNNS